MKLIVTDMDGTLLDEKRSVSKENEEAIKAAHKQGAVVAIATGRDLYEATVPLKKQGYHCRSLVRMARKSMMNTDDFSMKPFSVQTKPGMRWLS